MSKNMERNAVLCWELIRLYPKEITSSKIECILKRTREWPPERQSISSGGVVGEGDYEQKSEEESARRTNHKTPNPQKAATHIHTSATGRRPLVSSRVLLLRIRLKHHPQAYILRNDWRFLWKMQHLGGNDCRVLKTVLIIDLNWFFFTYKVIILEDYRRRFRIANTDEISLAHCCRKWNTKHENKCNVKCASM